MSKVLFFGPYPNPITGQSIAFREVYDNYLEDKILVDVTRFGDNKFKNTIYCLFKTPLIFMTNKFDVIYFTCSRSKLGFIKDFILLAFCKIFNKKVVNHLHGNDFKHFYEESDKLSSIIKWAYSGVHTSIVLLPKMKSQFDNFSKMEIEVVTNCYPKELDSYEIIWEKKKEQLLYLSNLMESKGILYFLDAVSVILVNRPELIVKIAGVPMGDYISSSIEIEIKFNTKYSKIKKEFPDQIFYLGSVMGDAKLQLLHESSIFSLPTFYITEAFPISILEAMRCGTPVIAYYGGGYKETVVNGVTGVFFKEATAESLIEAIKKFEKGKFDPEKCRKQAEKFSKERFKREIKNFVSDKTKQ